MFCLTRSQTIRKHYDDLHAAGVIHNDVEWRHVLLRGNQIRLIDFDRALTRDDAVDDDMWQRMCRRENIFVARMLGLSR